MSFTCTFYNISDPPNKLSKTLGTAIHTATCSPFNPVSDLHGEIIVDYNSAIEAANYCVIEAGTQDHAAEGRPRYCYIKDLIKRNGGRLVVELEEDALMTFSTSILDMKILATRASVIGRDNGNVGYNAFLQDGFWKCDATHLYWLSEDLMGGYFDYDDHGDPLDYVLMTAG